VLSFKGKDCCFVSFSLNAGNNIAREGAIMLFEALKSNSALTSLNLQSNRVVTFISFSLNTNTGNDIGDEGTLKLAEVLKSNSTLKELDLYRNCHDN
jgi:hypothetical protein